MNLPSPLHRWNLTPAAARRLQSRLAQKVEIRSLPRPPRLTVGLDAAFTPDGESCLAAAVVWEPSSGSVVEQATACRRLRFPYVPGLLSFREAPALLQALRRLRSTPDILVCDGQGLAHPRRFGLACHMGVLTGLPSFGCAKSRLCGIHTDPGQSRGSNVALILDGEEVGRVLRTQDGGRPVYVSVGFRTTLPEIVRLAMEWVVGRHRIPEPTRLADKAVARFKATQLKPGPPPEQALRARPRPRPRE